MPPSKVSNSKVPVKSEPAAAPVVAESKPAAQKGGKVAAAAPVAAAPAAAPAQKGGKAAAAPAAATPVKAVAKAAAPAAKAAAPAAKAAAPAAKVGGAAKKAAVGGAAKKVAAPKKAAAPKQAKAKKVEGDAEAEEVDEDEKGVRSFKVQLPGNEDFAGRFTGLTPYQAANKALSKYFCENKTVKAEITFSIRESTRGSKRSTYTYNGKREKLNIPVKYSIKSADGVPREIVKEYKNKLTKVKKGDAKEVVA